MRQIDHIVYAVEDLHKGIECVYSQTGVRPVYGGRHLNKGTHNALLNLGYGAYLEIISSDPNNIQINADRWMGVDLIDRPMITRWCIKSDNLINDQAILKRYNSNMGEKVQGSRVTASGDTLQWQMILPLSNPKVEPIPFMVDWSSSLHHPCDKLEDQCQLIDIMLSHPNPPTLNKVLLELDSKSTIQQGVFSTINIKLLTPKGEVIL